MREDRAVLPMLVALAMQVSAAPPAHSDEVNMSRNRVTAIMNAQFSIDAVLVFQTVDPTVSAAFCEDGDGCTVRLLMVHPVAGLRGDERLLFKNGANWLTAGEPSAHVDGDGPDSNIILLGTGTGDFCVASDIDASGSDNSAGFSVVASFNGGGSTPGFSCLLTLVD